MAIQRTTSRIPGFIREPPAERGSAKTVPPLRDRAMRKALKEHAYLGPFAAKSGLGHFYLPVKGRKDSASTLNAIIVSPGPSGTIENQIGLDRQLGFGTDTTVHSMEDVLRAARLASEVRGELSHYLKTGRSPPDSRRLIVRG